MDCPARAGLLLALLLLVSSCGDNPSAGLPPALPDRALTLDAVLSQQIEARAERIRANPADAQAHAHLAFLYEANEVWEPARRAYANAISLSPASVDWRFHAALCAARDGDSAEAHRVFEQLAQDSPDFAPARHSNGLAKLENGDLATAEAELLAAHQMRNTVPETHAALAQLRIVQGRHGEALPLAEKAVELSRGAPRARFVRGQALRGLGRIDEAETDLAVGAGSKPGRLSTPLDSELPRHVLGVSVQVDRAADLIETGRFDEAIALLERALIDRPKHRALSINLAIAYQLKGRPKDSIPILDALLAAAPNDGPVLLNLAEALWLIQDHRRGDEITRRVCAAQPDQGLAHFARARVLYALGQTGPAITHCERAAELEPRNAEIHSALAEGLFLTQQFAKAEPHFRRASELDPRSLSHRTNLCATLMRLGRRGDAESLLRDLTTIAPEHPKVQALQNLFVQTEGAAPRPASASEGPP